MDNHTEELRKLIEKGLISAPITIAEVKMVIRSRMLTIGGLQTDKDNEDTVLVAWLLDSLQKLNEGLLPKKHKKINSPVIRKIKGRKLAPRA